MTLQEIADQISSKASGSGFNRSVKFDLGGDGSILVDGESVSTGTGDAECTISLTKDDMESIMSGDLNATSAFMQGKLKVDGDMSVAMQLSQVL
jgi:putative sterol carrier protein